MKRIMFKCDYFPISLSEWTAWIDNVNKYMKAKEDAEDYITSQIIIYLN